MLNVVEAKFELVQLRFNTVEGEGGGGRVLPSLFNEIERMLKLFAQAFTLVNRAKTVSSSHGEKLLSTRSPYGLLYQLNFVGPFIGCMRRSVHGLLI